MGSLVLLMIMNRNGDIHQMKHIATWDIRVPSEKELSLILLFVEEKLEHDVFILCETRVFKVFNVLFIILLWLQWWYLLLYCGRKEI